MKTHELGRALSQLAKALLAAPNMELGDLGRQLSDKPKQLSNEGIAVNLSTLADLSRVQRSEWVAFIKEYDLPIEIRARDASRDIIGKLLNHLESDQAARDVLKAQNGRKSREASPELMRALQTLLKDQ